MSGLFAEIKPSCVGLLRFATLTPTSIPEALNFLTEITSILRVHSAELPQLPPSLVSYIFFPVSNILQRNSLSIIPDQVLEKILVVLGLLSENWWWHDEVKIWEQIFMLCGSVLGGMANKGKGKERDEEVKEAAAQCLYALLRGRDGDFIQPSKSSTRAKDRLLKLQDHTRSPRFIPIFGQTLSAMITTGESPSSSLQRVSLKVLRVLLDSYASDDLFPMVLPGIVSSMSKVALGTNLEKQWANGELVANALLVMQIAIVRSIGDEICIREGVLRSIEDLEDLAELVSPSTTQPSQNNAESPFPTRRSVSWLKGTTSQLHIAINNLHSLVAHPNPDALRGLALFARTVLQATPQSLPQTQPLLITFLLSLSNSSFPAVALDAQTHLSDLLSSSSKVQSTLLSTLVHNLSQNLLALPRLVSIHEESKIQHLSGLIEATCRLASTRQEEADHPRASIAKGIGKLLGPSGGIEKWGWNLLAVYEFVEQSITIAPTSTEQLMLENDPENLHWTTFPGLQLKSLRRDTLTALEQMFRALGAAGGETCLYSVEWFVGIGKAGTDKSAVAALWCACHLLEGVSRIKLSSEDSPGDIPPKATKRLERLVRSLARSLPEVWDLQNDVEVSTSSSQELRDNASTSLVEYRKSFEPLHENLKIIRTSPVHAFEKVDQPINHRAISLQIMSCCVGVLQARSSSLFIHVLYPVLHSLISQAPFLASTAYASLQYMTVASSYASPANLLLSNFDYALDSISRRLTRRWLDVDATRVLLMLVRLVGSDVVEKAGDVVEECFDRLDEFHGYDILVEGLVNVLTEVTKVLGSDSKPVERREKKPGYTPYAQLSSLSEFFIWYRRRQEQSNETDVDTEYGPAPRRAWGEEKTPVEDSEGQENEAMGNAADPNAEPTPTPTQALTKQIVNRSMYFLTHGSPVIRARILNLLASSIYSLPASALMPAIHSAWPFILNRLADRETFVVSGAASLIEALSTYMGEFMFRRIWDDVWPRFKTLLSQLQAGDAASALVRRAPGAVGTESSYTHSHRLYRSIINTMTAALQDVQPHENSLWDVLILFRRFLHSAVHPELQQSAQKLYKAAKTQDADSVWLVLTSTAQQDHTVLSFMYQPKWDVSTNVDVILHN